jgi:IS5 family transposase
MVGKIDKTPQLNIFETPLTTFINLNHELCILANEIEWQFVESEFTGYYTDFGRPSIPIRKIVGLVLLRQIYNLSDEALIDRWIENPYWQYFCGEHNFQKIKPMDPTEFVKFRKRIGAEGAEKLLKLSIKLFGNEAKEKEVLVDSTVQEKNITYPTDSKLHHRIIKNVNKIADESGIKLRQTYKRISKQLLIDQRFRNHPKRKKKAHAAARKLKTIAGRLVRDVDRKMNDEQKTQYSERFDVFRQILKQKKTDKNKIYSLHELAVSCIAKGKEAKKFEFGNKTGIVLTKNGGIIVGALAFENNLYDGHTLEEHLSQTERLTGHRPKVGIVDRGYRGRKNIEGTEIISPKPPGKNATNYQKQKARKRFRARAGIEPIIGHIKHDHRMLRNYLKGAIGDKINTLIAAAAFNFKKKLNRIKVELLYIFIFNLEIIFSTKYFSLNNIRKKGLFQG